MGCSFCANRIRKRSNVQVGNRVIPLRSTRFCSYMHFLLRPSFYRFFPLFYCFFFPFLSFFLSFRFHCRLYRDRFSCSRDEHARGKGKRHPNENEQASIGPFGALGRHSSCEIPQPVYLPICQHISIGVSLLFSTDERNVTVRTICLGI